MSLAVIGAGLGRTGTLSHKQALEQLGFGPCHHMEEAMAHPGQIPTWHAAGRGAPSLSPNQLRELYRINVGPSRTRRLPKSSVAQPSAGAECRIPPGDP